MEFIDYVWRILVHRVGHEVALVLFSILSVLGYACIRLVARALGRLWCFLGSRRRALRAVGRERTKSGLREGQGVWVTNPIEPPDDYQRGVEAAKILVLANLKGGVGKTTVAANIGAFLAKDKSWRKNVLLIDLDYQGSLSSMALPEDDRWLPPPGQDSVATRGVSGDLDAAIFVSCAKETRQEPRLKVITAHYDLAQADNRLLIEWLIQCRQRTARNLRHALGDLLHGKLFRMRDVRYNLADLLHSDAVSAAFDLVIIDCPPRLTTGMIQALCAGSHLLIPTILDRPSADAVTQLAEQVEALKRLQICPHLKYLGIVATKHQEGLLAAGAAAKKLEADLADKRIQTGMLPSTTFIPQTVALVREADEGIAYFVMANSQQEVRAREAIGALATYVATHMGLPPLQTFVGASGEK